MGTAGRRYSAMLRKTQLQPAVANDKRNGSATRRGEAVRGDVTRQGEGDGEKSKRKERRGEKSARRGKREKKYRRQGRGTKEREWRKR